MEGGKVERVCDFVLGLPTLRLTLCHSAGQQSREEVEEVMAPRQVTNTVMEPRQVTSTVMEPQQQVPLRILPSLPLLQAIESTWANAVLALTRTRVRWKFHGLLALGVSRAVCQCSNIQY